MLCSYELKVVEKCLPGRFLCEERFEDPETQALSNKDGYCTREQAYLESIDSSDNDENDGSTGERREREEQDEETRQKPGKREVDDRFSLWRDLFNVEGRTSATSCHNQEHRKPTK